ncbi:hypothetical protein [Aquimarina aggregata]|uniref:hypothetical protein n=1 Tax=Aquimarina aggregata TaxID=1642818 RepID=UPI0024922ACD|nr:hypothetical protein [Aquimarina aggregata]
MKTHKSNTLQLKKLTVAKITPNALSLLNGGSSLPTSTTQELGTVQRRGGMCHLQAR